MKDEKFVSYSLYKNVTWVRNPDPTTSTTTTLDVPETPELLQGTEEEGFPRKFWKKIKIKQAIDRARRERLRGCHPGDFAFTFANDPRNEGNTGIVTGCISGLHCPQVGGPASSVRVVTNEDGFGIGEYFQGNDTQQIFNNFTVDAHCNMTFELSNMLPLSRQPCRTPLWALSTSLSLRVALAYARIGFS